jgi:hypothetical protein
MRSAIKIDREHISHDFFLKLSFPPGLSEIEIKRRLCQRFYDNEANVEAYIEHLVQLKLTEP